MNDMLLDDLVRETKVKINGKDYVLREASGEAARRYRNAVMKASRPTSDGILTMAEGLADTDSLLLSLCLFEIAENGSTIPIQQSALMIWPFRLQQKLFDWVIDVSELGLKETLEALNKRIASDQAKLEKLKSNAEDSAKN